MWLAPVKHVPRVCQFGESVCCRWTPWMRWCQWRAESGTSATGRQDPVVTSPGGEQGTAGLQEAALTGKHYKNDPFVKDLFLSKFDTSVLVYPEFETTEEVEQMKGLVQSVTEFFQQSVDSRTIDETGCIPEEVLLALKKIGLFGQIVPEEYGGMGLGAKQYAKMCAATALDGSVATSLAAHQSLATKVLLMYGTEEQKRTFLPRLIPGESIAAFCLTEEQSGSDLASTKTTGEMTEDGLSCVMNGTKSWVTNGAAADILLVFAQISVINALGNKEENISAILVDKKASDGISTSPPYSTLGLRAANCCDITFQNTEVPLNNVIGDIGSGFQVALSVMNNSRYTLGITMATVLKQLLGQTTERMVTRTLFNEKLKDFGLVQEKMAHVAMTAYVMESMSFLTAGIIDKYEKPEVDIETAIVKVYSSEEGLRAISNCMMLLGADSYRSGSQLERRLRDAQGSVFFDGSNDLLKLYIALSGVQYASQTMADTVRKLTNPLNNISFVIKRVLQRKQSRPLSPRLRLQLHDHIHPSLTFSGEELEKRTLQFEHLVEHCLGIYTKDIVHEQITLKRLANIAIDLYGMTAVIGRAGRSMSIGLRDADHEVLLAQLFTHQASQRIQRMMDDIYEGKFNNGDDVCRKIAEEIQKHNGWAVQDVMERNW